MRRVVLCAVACLSAAPAVHAQTSFPMITHVHPVALERGKTTEVLVEGQMNFFGAYKTLFEGTGPSAEIVPQKAPPPKPPQPPLVRDAKLKITVAPDAALGVREFRIATELGISSVGQLVIVDDPVVIEDKANNVVAQAQSIALPCVLAGKLEAVEDVDFYKFDAKEGQTLTFEMFCARIQDKIHDLQKHAKPMLTLYDAGGRELAANDTFFFADPLLSYTIPRTGAYYLQVRESTYDGDRRWVYAIIATGRPYVTHVFPVAGNPGQKLEVEPIGSAKLVQAKAPFVVPKETGIQQIQLDVNGVTMNPATFIVSSLPQFLERDANDEPAKATRVTLPAGINGRIEKRRDMDHFVFKATKGKPVRFELKARRFGTLLNSSLHGVLDVMNIKGATIASNEVTHGQEAALVFTPPADGDFVIRVRDLNSKGGETFVYYLEADWAVPDFTLRCDPDKAMIGPGSSAAWYVHVNRLNGFAGPVKVEIKDLPKDITATPLTIPPKMTQGMMVLTADPKAQIQANFVRIVGTGTAKMPDGKEVTLTRHNQPEQEIYFPGGGRGVFNVNTHAVAVTNPSDILKVDVSAAKISLKPGQEVKIDVTVERRPDYDKGVTLDVTLQHLGRVFGNPLPPGVTVVTGKSKTLLGTASKGHIVLKAAANAEPIEDVPISVVANVSINFVVKVAYSSPPIWMSVRKPAAAE
ncbi:MAG: PPC domain-containing protein [Gemmataceae bacterium]|nr:PPC domain-containing protein [Gemmataceae bacterium]